MTPEEIKRKFLRELAEARTKSEVREVVEEADSAIKQSNFSKSAEARIFGELIQEAQDNSATMANSGEAEKIVNQILNSGK